MTIAIVGAAGAIGHAVARTLTERGRSVRLIGRDRSKLEAVEREVARGAELVAADVSTSEGCERALRGADAAIYALGLPYTKTAFAGYPRMMRDLLAAARAAGTKRIVLISNVYPYGKPRAPTVSEEHPRVPCSVKGEWRKQQEDLLLAAHGDGLGTLSLRLPNFYGPHASLSILDGVFRAAVQGRRADLLGPIDLPQELFFVPDAGPLIADLLDRPEAFGRPYNVAGHSLTTFRKMAEGIYAAAGEPPRLRVASPRMVKVFGVFSSLMRELGEMSYLQTTPVLLDDARLRAVLPSLRKTPYEEGIARTVAHYQRMAGAPAASRALAEAS